MKVTKVEPHPKNADWRIVTTDDARQWIVFAGSLADALEVGKPLPEGTEEQEPKFEGALPALRLPKPQRGQGGQSAYRNTKEGSAAEQERMDRRTALMQAVAWVSATRDFPHEPGLVDIGADYAWAGAAEAMYKWLRKTSGSGGLPEKTGEAQVRLSKPAPDPGTTSAPPLRNGPSPSDGAEPGAEGKAQPEGEGRGKPNPPSLEQWSAYGELGGTASKAVIAARRKGWDMVKDSGDLTAELLDVLIADRKAELGG